MLSITWDVARAGGFTAYLLITASVVVGLVLSLKWRSTSYPRFLTSDVHRQLALLALIFTAIHGFAVWIDPFQRFGLSEVLVPFQAHYRPLWIAFGIIAGYLMLALFVSEYLRSFIGYRWWRYLHYLTFATWVLSTAHGLGTGSDSRAAWAFTIYALSFAGVGTLLAARFLEARRGHWGLRLAAAGAAALIGVWGWNWALSGPMRPGWNAIANNSRGSGVRDPAVIASLAASTAKSAPSSSASGLSVPLTANVSGTIGYGRSQSQIVIQLTLEGSAGAEGSARMVLYLLGTSEDRVSIDGQRSSLIIYTPSGRTWCQGRPQGLAEGQLLASCQTSNGSALQVLIALAGGSGDQVTGTLQASAQ